MLASALGGPPFSFTVHGPEEFDKPEFLGLGEKIRRANAVVAISSFGRSQLWRWAAAVDWPKVTVVHCGLESTFFGDAAAAFTGARRLVCVGRLCEQKGQLLLVEAPSQECHICLTPHALLLLSCLRLSCCPAGWAELGHHLGQAQGISGRLCRL